MKNEKMKNFKEKEDSSNVQKPEEKTKAGFYKKGVNLKEAIIISEIIGPPLSKR